MKIFDKIWRIVSRTGHITNKVVRKIAGGILAIIAPERESIKRLAKMSPAEIKKLIPPPIWKSVMSVGSSGFNTENLHALFAYGDPLARQIVWEIKYRKNSVLADKVGQLIFEEMVGVVGKISSGYARENLRAKIIIAPIPSSKHRRRERGFNQCEVVCEAIMRCASDVRCESDILCGARENLREIFIYEPNLIAKIKDTPHQADLPREKRLKNISGSFNVPSPEKVAGKIIFIVDDVITTGKTISEAQKILTGAGAKRVYGFAIAH